MTDVPAEPPDHIAAIRSVPPAGAPAPHDRRALADRITEDVMQLLYTARQDLAEATAEHPEADLELLRSAHDCTTAAISILRGVVGTALGAAWGPSPDGPEGDGAWEAPTTELFDVLSDAWVITCEADDLLHASPAACEVLGHSPAQISALMHQPDGWPRRLVEAPAAAGEEGTAFELEVPLPDGTRRTIGVVSHLLPAPADGPPSYVSRVASLGT